MKRVLWSAAACCRSCQGSLLPRVSRFLPSGAADAARICNDGSKRPSYERQQAAALQTCLALLVVCVLSSLSPSAFAASLAQHPVLLRVGPQPCAVAAADLNGDDIPEIVTADRGTLVEAREERPANDELSVLLSEAPLRYVRRHPSLKTGFGPYALAIANIDALKWPDIVVACFHDARNRDLALFLNLKHEDLFEPYYFEAPDTTLTYYRQLDGDDAPMFTTPGFTSVVVQDFNNDKFRDAIAAGWSSDVLAYYPGDAEKYFGVPRFIEAPGGPRALALGDFNGDGHTDLAAAMYVDAEIALWQGDGAGGFTSKGRFPSRGRLPSTLLADDINGDDKQDLVVSHSFTDDSVVIFFGDGAWGFGLSQEVLLGPDREVLEEEVRGIATGDFDGNGSRDIAAACAASKTVRVLLNMGPGETSKVNLSQEKYSFELGAPHALCTADFNQDQRDDLAVTLWQENAVALLLGKK